MRRDLAASQSRLSTASYILRMVQARLASSRKLERLSLYGFGKLPLVLVPPKTPYLWLNARVAFSNSGSWCRRANFRNRSGVSLRVAWFLECISSSPVQGGECLAVSQGGESLAMIS